MTSEIDIGSGAKNAPTHYSYQDLIYFYQTHSHNIHLKLARLELTIKSLTRLALTTYLHVLLK